MLLSETAKILAKIQLIDNRTVDLETVKAWHEAIGRFEFADAMTALTLHRQDSTEFVMPGHIKDNVRRAKAMRASNEARQRAILTSRAREILAARGEEATPVRMQEVRELLANTPEAQTGELIQFEKPEHIGWTEEPAA